MISGAFSASSSIGGKVGIAIVLHKFPDGFVLSSLLNQNPKFKHQRKHRLFSSFYNFPQLQNPFKSFNLI